MFRHESVTIKEYIKQLDHLIPMCNGKEREMYVKHRIKMARYARKMAN